MKNNEGEFNLSLEKQLYWVKNTWREDYSHIKYCQK